MTRMDFALKHVHVHYFLVVWT